MLTKKRTQSGAFLLYNENHAIVVWYSKGLAMNSKKVFKVLSRHLMGLVKSNKAVVYDDIVHH